VKLFFALAVVLPLPWSTALHAQDAARCANLAKDSSAGASVQITKAEHLAAGVAPAAPNGVPAPAAALPAYCRVDGVIDERTGVGGKKYGIHFALALPDHWTGRFLFQGGGGLNGNVAPPLGAAASGNHPALARGFAVVTTDTGHQGAVFDGSFFQDQQAALDFYYEANGRVAALAKDLLARYYGRPANRSYFVGCSTGGREGMILSQRHPTDFDGIVSGDPAIRTGHSNLALAFIQSTFEQAAPKGADGKPQPLFSAAERKLIVDSLLRACDDKDGLKDGMIFNFEACLFDPATLICRGSKTDACLSAAQAAALKKAFAGPKDSHGNAVYPGFPYDAGIADTGRAIPGLLNGPRIPVPVASSGPNFDVDQRAAQLTNDANARLGDATWTNLSTFSGHGGKLIFYHGPSDPWFSPLDTLGYYEKMARDNGGQTQVENWSRIFFVPGMSHCQGGNETLDNFDMLTAITDWVENGKAPDSIPATGRDFPGRSRPLCPYPQHAQYSGQGDPNDAHNFSCRE
jgi:hypothetical protein